ncbi:MAG: CvpA family protein [Alphaproteobacteria bacterium]|nr:CvpA family protein [Alphaproteobacteria bacterium]
MFDLTTLDYIYIGLVLVSTVWASIRGGVYETVATLSWVIAAVAARFVSPMLDGLFQSWFKLSESTIGTLVASYFIVFFVILILFGMINQKLRDRIQESMLSVTDHTFGIVFGIIRGVVVMGFVYWALLWYYSDTSLPSYVTEARTRPVMQLTAVKLHDWFIPGGSKLLERDMADAADAQQIYENLISPAVAAKAQIEKTDAQQEAAQPAAEEAPAMDESLRRDLSPKASAKGEAKTEENVRLIQESLPEPAEIGYKNSERQELDNQLMQIESKN